MTKALFPGSFDPITLGHESIIKRSARVFDKIIVAVAVGMHKKTLLDHNLRLKLVKKSCAQYKNVEVVPYNGLLADCARTHKCNIILRGLRAFSDFEFESQLASINKKLDSQLETLLFLPDVEYLHLSSSLTKEIAQLDGDLSKFVSKHVLTQMSKYDHKSKPKDSK